MEKEVRARKIKLKIKISSKENYHRHQIQYNDDKKIVDATPVLRLISLNH